jgi:hypothetical protein
LHKPALPFLQLVHVEEVGRSASARLRRTYFRSISRSRLNTTARAASSSSGSISKLAEATRLRVPPEFADPIGAVEVRESQDVEMMLPSPVLDWAT